MWHHERVEAIGGVRTWLGEQIRQRIVGDDGERRAQELFGTDGRRWFEPGSAIWRVHSDTSMFIGGLRALLLQSLHPLAMAGVAQHSDYRGDPWGRLQRTADYLAATTFGPEDEARRSIEMVRRVHERVVGTASDGRPYSANDPHLLRWVHIAEVDSFLAAHDRYGTARLDADERDEYVAQMATIARRLGVPAPPESVRSLRDQLRSYRPELRGTPEARDAARYLLLQPPIPFAGRGPYAMIAAAAVALLPAWARLPLRLPLLPVTETVAARPVGVMITRLMRWSTGPSPAETVAVSRQR